MQPWPFGVELQRTAEQESCKFRSARCMQITLSPACFLSVQDAILFYQAFSRRGFEARPAGMGLQSCMSPRNIEPSDRVQQGQVQPLHMGMDAHSMYRLVNMTGVTVLCGSDKDQLKKRAETMKKGLLPAETELLHVPAFNEQPHALTFQPRTAGVYLPDLAQHVRSRLCCYVFKLPVVSDLSADGTSSGMTAAIAHHHSQYHHLSNMQTVVALLSHFILSSAFNSVASRLMLLQPPRNPASCCCDSMLSQLAEYTRHAAGGVSHNVCAASGHAGPIAGCGG